MLLNRVSKKKDYSSDEISIEGESINYADYLDGDVYQDSDINNIFSVLQDQAYSLPKNEVYEDPHFSLAYIDIIYVIVFLIILFFQKNNYLFL